MRAALQNAFPILHREIAAQSRLKEVIHAINKAAIKLTTGQLAFDQPIKADVLAKT